MKDRPNTKGIKAAAKRRTQETLERAKRAIEELKKSKKPITFISVAEAANVSTSWLYKDDTIREEIELLREQSKPEKGSSKSRATKASRDVMVRTLRTRNSKLMQELKSLKDEMESLYGMLSDVEEERDQLRTQLEMRKMNLDKNAVKSSPSGRKISNQEIDFVETVQDICGTKLSPDIIELIQISDPETVEKAIAALKPQIDKVKNRVGWLRRAIEGGWEPANSSESLDGRDRLPPEFKKWYDQAVEEGFLQNMPINELGTMSGEIQVRVNRPDHFGAPYTPMRWTQAKLEWEAQR